MSLFSGFSPIDCNYSKYNSCIFDGDHFDVVKVEGGLFPIPDKLSLES